VKLGKIGRRFVFVGMFVDTLGIEDERKGEEKQG
jgi:hypothetical protein